MVGDHRVVLRAQAQEGVLDHVAGGLDIAEVAVGVGHERPFVALDRSMDPLGHEVTACRINAAAAHLLEGISP